MKVGTVFLVICFCLSVLGLNAQVQPAGIEKYFEKYISKTGNSQKLSAEGLILVRFNRTLTATEILLLNPKKKLAGDYFIVEKSPVSSLSNHVIFQEKANGLWKASDRLIKVLTKATKKNDSILVRLSFKNINALPGSAKNLSVKSIDRINNMIMVYILPADLMLILELDDILYADVLPVAKEEVVINGLDLGLNQISNAHSLFPGIDGAGINVAFFKGNIYPRTIDTRKKTVCIRDLV